MKDVIDGAKTEVETFPPDTLTHANRASHSSRTTHLNYSTSALDCFYNLEWIYLFFFAVWLALSFMSCFDY